MADYGQQKKIQGPKDNNLEKLHITPKLPANCTNPPLTFKTLT